MNKVTNQGWITENASAFIMGTICVLVAKKDPETARTLRRKERTTKNAKHTKKSRRSCAEHSFSHVSWASLWKKPYCSLLGSGS
ncbi:MAG: hypothetical protein N838_01115 [Thiohalocapsa sp. PB-PSB1]|jgi:hypothetical protein|nr:MAG: hypothetical protein N838_01115 [Thiohalocapsa sp. PB-PSB1]